LDILAAGHEARRQLVLRHEGPMPRRLVVEAETGPCVADDGRGGVALEPLERSDRFGEVDRSRLIHRAQRIRAERMLDVGQDELLMLLLVLQAELDRRLEIWLERRALEQLAHVLVDVGAIGVYFGETGARQQAARVTRVLRADRVVIRIEETPEVRLEGAIAARVRFEHERLEEPTRVREMPFRRAGVRHRLNLAVFRRQWRRAI